MDRGAGGTEGGDEGDKKEQIKYRRKRNGR